MFAILIDLETEALKKFYGEPYDGAYKEIRKEMKTLGFEWVQEGLYVTTSSENELVKVFEAIDLFKKTEWLKKSTRNVQSFKIESCSNFTNRVKAE